MRRLRLSVVAMGLLAACAEPTVPAAPPMLRLSEVRVVKGRGDGFEVVNASGQAVALAGWQVQGGAGRLPLALPALELAPGAYLTVSLAGADFGLSRTDELLLYGPDGRLLDALSWTAADLGVTHAFGRVTPDGLASALQRETPNEPNAPPCDQACVAIPSAESDYLPGVGDLHLTLSQNALAELNEAREQRLKRFVPATVTWRGQTVTGRVRLRGNAFIDEWMRFDQFLVRIPVAGGSRHRRLLLDRGRVGRQHLHNTLAMAAMRLAGVPAPRTAHVRLFLNGERVGLYESIEPIDEDFLDRSFRGTTGALHTGDELRFHDRSSNPAGHAALQQALWDAWSRGDEGGFDALARSAFQLESLLTLFAVEVAIGAEENCATDGVFSDNCALYSTEAGIVAIPWDQDDNLDPVAPVTRFGASRSETGPSILRYMLDHPEWRARFECELDRVARHVMPELAAVAAAECATVAEDLAADGVEPAARCGELVATITRRTQEIRAQLGPEECRTTGGSAAR